MKIRSQRGLINILALGLIAALSIFMLGATILNNINTEKLELALVEAEEQFLVPSNNVGQNSATGGYSFDQLLLENSTGVYQVGTHTIEAYVVPLPPCPINQLSDSTGPCGISTDSVLLGATADATDTVLVQHPSPDFFESDILYEFTLKIEATNGPVTATDFAILDATVTWETYTSDAYGFTVRHPAVGEPTSDPIYNPIISTGITDCSFRYNGEGLGRGIGPALSPETVNVGGVERNKRRYSDVESGLLSVATIIMDNNISWIEIFYPGNSDNNACEKVINQMLSTFQFTN